MNTPVPAHEFVTLIEANQGIIHKVCHLYRKDPDDRKDLFQEIVIQLWKSFASFRHEAKITTWMYRVALNTAIADFRKLKRQPEKTALSDHLAQTLNYEEDTEKEENSRLLYAAIARLTDIEKAIIMLYLEDCDYEEIAETVGITQNYVRVKMNRIREKLRQLMKPETLWN